MTEQSVNNGKVKYQPIGEHLEDLRRVLIRVIAVVVLLTGVVFCFKRATFSIIIAPSRGDFWTFEVIGRCLRALGMDYSFETYNFSMISTELSAQFMMHVYISVLVACVLASPYILYELFRFVSPALYEKERKYSVVTAVVIYLLFVAGVLMSYFILFPISFRFLANYQVDETVVNTITLNSYISTFATLTFLMGVVFQVPVIVYFLGKMGLVSYGMLKRYRGVAFVVILIIAAAITPPDVLTLIITALPLYALFEFSLCLLKRIRSQTGEESCGAASCRRKSRR